MSVFDRNRDSLQNIFAVQDKISAAISDALNVTFAGMHVAPTLNPRAHELYLRGLAALDNVTAADAQAAQKLFQHALALDPRYADAWAGLAGSYLALARSEEHTSELQSPLKFVCSLLL